MERILTDDIIQRLNQNNFKYAEDGHGGANCIIYVTNTNMDMDNISSTIRQIFEDV